MIRDFINEFVETNVPLGSDGQINRAAQRLGLIAAAGEYAVNLGVVPWPEGEAKSAAAWALKRWIDGRGGIEPAEARQATETVRLFVEKYEKVGSNLWTSYTRGLSIAGRDGGWELGRIANGWSHRKFGKQRFALASTPRWLPGRLPNAACCGGRAMASRSVRKINGANKRVYVLMAKIFDGAGEQG